MSCRVVGSVRVTSSVSCRVTSRGSFSCRVLFSVRVVSRVACQIRVTGRVRVVFILTLFVFVSCSCRVLNSFSCHGSCSCQGKKISTRF